MSKITLSKLNEILDYDPVTGIFSWRVSLAKRISPGDKAGSDDGSGYLQICIYGRRYKAHRLAWMIMTGSWPQDQIDHLNGVRSDNRWANLRSVIKQENAMNKAIQKNNTSGVNGVYWSSRFKKWFAQINVKSKRINLGSFTDFDSAVAVRKAAEKVNGFHKNHGRK